MGSREDQLRAQREAQFAKPKPKPRVITKVVRVAPEIRQTKSPLAPTVTRRPGRPPIGAKAMTHKERQKRWLAKGDERKA